jgi:hypothetical protein
VGFLGKKGFDSKWKISFLITLIFVFLLSIWNYKNRCYDWDMPGYMGCFYTMIISDNPEKVHHLIYEEIKKEAPDYEYNDIIGAKKFDRTRQYFTKNTQSFSEQLPYFQIKVGYNLALLSLYKLGFTGPMSVTMLSIISYFISGLLLFFVFKNIFPDKPWLSGFLSIMICLLPPFAYISRISTPDIFVFQFMLVFMIGFLRKWSDWSMFLVLFLITFVRPDYITFTLTYLFTLLIYSYYKDKKVKISYCLQAVLLLLIYFTILKYYNYPGWKALFYDTFIYRRPFISTEIADFTLREYLEILLYKLLYFKKVTVISVTLLFMIFYLSKDLYIRLISVFIFVNIYIKFVFFPQSAELRFYISFIILLLLMMLYALSKKYKNFQLRKIA